MNKVLVATALLVALGADAADERDLVPSGPHRDLLMTGCIQDQVGALVAKTAVSRLRALYEFRQELLGPTELQLQRADGTLLTLGWNDVSFVCVAEIPYEAVAEVHFSALLTGVRDDVTRRYGEIAIVETVPGGEEWRLQTAEGGQLLIELVQAARAIEIRSVTTVETQ